LQCVDFFWEASFHTKFSFQIAKVGEKIGAKHTGADYWRGNPEGPYFIHHRIHPKPRLQP